MAWGRGGREGKEDERPRGRVREKTGIENSVARPRRLSVRRPAAASVPETGSCIGSCSERHLRAPREGAVCRPLPGREPDVDIWRFWRSRLTCPLHPDPGGLSTPRPCSFVSW